MGQDIYQDGDYPIDFCTLGMFIIDEIHFPPPTPPALNVLGGAGPYAALGARLFSAPPQSCSVGWIVDEGRDFPEAIRETIRAWDTSCLFRKQPDRQTTRAWNGYGVGEKRAFKYLTPKLLLDEHTLTPSLLLSKAFHLICSPARCIDLVTGIKARRAEVERPGSNLQSRVPLFIWEPVPTSCVPDELDSCIKALRHVDLVSPNHHELGALLGHEAGEHEETEVHRSLVEELCKELKKRCVHEHGRSIPVIVRTGKEGCYLSCEETSRWLPAYHQPRQDGSDQPKVVDPTGGGNAFLGCLSIELGRGQSLEEAAVRASVAASFAIEQVGMPRLEHSGHRETWNGVQVHDRLADFKQRLA